MKDRTFTAFDLNCTIHYMFTLQLKTVPFWHANVPFKRTLTIVKFYDRMKKKSGAIKSYFRGMQPILLMIQYFYSCTVDSYILCRRESCVLLFLCYATKATPRHCIISWDQQFFAGSGIKIDSNATVLRSRIKI